MMRFDVEDAGMRRPPSTLRFFLLDEDGEPLDPAAFITAVHTWSVGDVLPFSSNETFRIIEMKTEIAPELAEAGFDGVWIVAPS